MAGRTHHEHLPSTGIAGGGSLDGQHLRRMDPTRSTIDIEQLLVHQGWLWLHTRLIDRVQEISIGTSTWRARARQRLTPREFQVAALVARGFMGKEVGSELAISEATVRGTLSRSLLKLGLAKGARLVAVWSALTRPPKSFTVDVHHTAFVFSCDLARREGHETLTPSERAILPDLLEGRSNRAISEQRGTSERTVANQVAILCRKLRVSTRRELSAMVLGGDDPTER
jgi:DNA-binding NarL/FixJ family response regulator